MIKIVKVNKLYLNSLLVSIVNRVSRSGTQVALADQLHIRKAFLMNVENVEMDNSLKCVLFIKVSGQITSVTL